ncbi:shugoshin 1 isoform X1 [Apteryx rowi]|uniref:shugoshin 1 isoform X1 n=1 Tax=Apteryx rowi TaxID=308060 RepID=UPI0006B0D98B|nr:PREDICTED: shugoshin-like 1 isoform X1 [Apteryx mantelli mantelli]XP_025933924.1 shugoshin 1 isoform X1 [Apteryx rowi]XP_025933925.1 shugoshin 1 isoform X1 [Apteryx rowi]
MAEHLKKPFKDSLSDIKERMKEKRNQKWLRLGKINQISNVKCKIATNSSMQMKSIQANNRALALALQEEKLKLREAQTTILHLREEYQGLKVQMFDLRRKLKFEQAQRSAETRLSALNEIISKVSQNLLDSVDLLGPAKNLCSTDNQSGFSSVLENNSGVIGQICSVRRSPFANGDNCILRREMEADSDGNEPAHSMSEICQESENTISLIKLVPDKGQTSDFHLDNAASELENLSSSEDRRFGNMLPKSVSTRRRYSKMRTHDELCTGVLDHSETPDSTRELSKQDEIRLEESLEKCTVENINSDISQLNKNKVGSELVLRQRDSAAAQFSSENISDFKQHEHKSREDSQVRREKHQKGKREGTKNTSRPRSKKRQGKETSREKLDFLGGSSDAYDFHFEECVHVTPFRQNKVNDTDDTGADDKEYLPETDSTESSNIEEDSDDSLYVPYTSKSKKWKSSVGKKDASPIHARPRSKRCLAQREQKLQNEKETKSSKSSDKSIREPSEPSRGLSDVTNTASSLLTGNALVVPESEGSPAPKRKRSCTLTVSYKEPSIAGKLRRGDPFTDTYFLNSPIFKQKKDVKRHSVKKESLSKYNEKFVGCR